MREDVSKITLIVLTSAILHIVSNGTISHQVSSLASTTPTLAAGDATVSLPASVFGQPMRKDILHRCVVWFLSTLRQGTQSTRTRSTVAYSGKKLRQQKGTGKARVGDAGSGTRECAQMD